MDDGLKRKVVQIMPAQGWYGVFFNYSMAAYQGEPVKLSIGQLVGWALVEVTSPDGTVEHPIEGLALHEGTVEEVGVSYVRDSFLGYTQDVADLEVFRAAAERRVTAALAEQERKKQQST